MILNTCSGSIKGAKGKSLRFKGSIDPSPSLSPHSIRQKLPVFSFVVLIIISNAHLYPCRSVIIAVLSSISFSKLLHPQSVIDCHYSSSFFLSSLSLYPWWLFHHISLAAYSALYPPFDLSPSLSFVLLPQFLPVSLFPLLNHSDSEVN